MGIKKINCIIEKMPTLVAARIDCYWFKQVIISYVSNAVEIALRLSEESEGKLYLEIENRNSRINIKDMAKLFSREEH
jgi:hypothetical protein